MASSIDAETALLPEPHTDFNEDSDSSVSTNVLSFKCAKGYAATLVPPPFRWLPKYKLIDIPRDIIAGVTVGVMAVPQGLAYASVAGLSPIVGLWTAFIAAIVYSLLGGSRDLIVGPVAIVSLLTGEFVRTYPNENPERLASFVSFGSGLILVGISLLRLGFITRLMSRAVVVGFTAAAALVIFFSQLKSALGCPLPPINTIIDFFRNIIAYGHLSNGWTILVSGMGVAFLLALKLLSMRFKWLSWVPGPLLLVIITTILSWSLHFSDNLHISIVGALPSGMPAFQPPVPLTSTDPTFTADAIRTMFVVALLGCVEHMSIGVTFAFKGGYASSFSGDVELWALGLAQFACSWFTGYAPTGSFTRTAVNAAAGARSQFAGLLCGVIVMFSFLFMAPVLYYLPQAALASIVIVGLLSLFEFSEAKVIWRASKLEFLLMISTFVATLLLGVESGVLIGVGLQLLLLIYREARLLNKVSAANQSQALVLRPKLATFSFLNASDVISQVEDQIHEWREKRKASTEPLKVVVDFTSVLSMDSSAAMQLRQYIKQSIDKMESPTVIIYFAGARPEVLATLLAVIPANTSCQFVDSVSIVDQIIPDVSSVNMSVL